MMKETCNEKYRLNELRQIITDIEDEFADAIHEKKKAEANYDYILMRFGSKAIVVIRSIIILSETGYPDEAMILARNLYESFIILSFFEMKKQDDDFETIIDDFFNNYDVIRFKSLKYEAESHGKTDIQKQYENGISSLKNNKKEIIGGRT